jgi:2,4-dienoyl-CoA reductase-like NADH-dependent reductase (Old Yellow Enzyme family)
VDAIDVSGTWHNLKTSACFREVAEKVAVQNKIPVILTGGIRDCDTINDMLKNTSIEYFAMGRPFIAEPDIVNRWYSEMSGSPSTFHIINAR